MIGSLRNNLIILQSRSCLVRQYVSKTKSETATRVVPPALRKKRAVKDATESKIPKEILNNCNSPEELRTINSFPSKFHKKRTTSDIFYMANDKQACHIADIITKDLRPDQMLLEANPGVGFITKHLLERTENNIILYESSSSLVNNLSVSKRFS